MPSFICSGGIPGKGLRDILRQVCYPGCRVEFSAPPYEEDGQVVCPGPTTVDCHVVIEKPYLASTTRGGCYMTYNDKTIGYFLDGMFFEETEALKRANKVLGSQEEAQQYLKLLPTVSAIG